jgi:hypothetical protein
MIFLTVGAPVPVHQCPPRSLSLYDDDSAPTNPQIRVTRKK